MPVTHFTEVWPRSERLEETFLGLATAQWRLALGALYLETGRYIPEEAKRRGCSFGYCNANGEIQPKRDPAATHLGWRLDEAAT